MAFATGTRRNLYAPEIYTALGVLRRRISRPRSKGIRFDGDSFLRAEPISRRAEVRHRCQNQANKTMYRPANNSTANHTSRTPGKIFGQQLRLTKLTER